MGKGAGEEPRLGGDTAGFLGARGFSATGLAEGIETGIAIGGSGCIGRTDTLNAHQRRRRLS